MQRKWISVMLIFMASVILYNCWLYGTLREVKFEWIQNFTAQGDEKPAPRTLSDEGLLKTFDTLLFGSLSSEGLLFVSISDTFDVFDAFNALFIAIQAQMDLIVVGSNGILMLRFINDNVPLLYYHQDPFQHYEELKNLGNLVQRRLHHLQNPVNCNTTRKIKCIIHGCGFGCRINTLGLCLMLGYATNRTVTVKPSTPSLIQPLSTTCTSAVGRNSSSWREDAEKFEVVDVVVPRLEYKPDFFPPAIPEDLADRMTHLHGNPFLWWAGQISSYVLRPTKATSEFLREQETKLGFSSPIVGIHIRRTDKLNKDAKYHFLDEYMVLVDRWYDDLEHSFPGVSRRLFLATDDPGVKSEINTMYPKYKVLTNGNFTMTGEDLTQRRTESGFLGIMHDVHMLSKCDYLVCTFSSNICRLAYQLMQSLRGNVTKNAVSLDRGWFIWGQIFNTKTDVVRAKMPLFENLDVQ